jgi:MerR family transcriptional regulator/heat shock protein HspR
MVGQLTAEGINLAGVVRIIDLQRRLEARDEENEQLRRQVNRLEKSVHEYELRNRITALAKATDQSIKAVGSE